MQNIILTLLLMVLTLTGCSERKTTNPKEAYKYWSGTNPNPDLELLNAEYWQSAGWSKEYVLYLKFKPTNEWWTAFLKQNSISPDQADWTTPIGAPVWFNPSTTSIRYGGGGDFDPGSRYFRDSVSGISYIYEIQF